MKVEKILKTMVEKGGSDLFLRAFAAPHARINGKIEKIGRASCRERV